MKVLLFLLVLAAGFSPVFSFASSEEEERGDNRLACDFSRGHFRVFDGAAKFEKYVGGADPAEVQLACGKGVAAAIVGGSFLFFEGGQFTEKYVGSAPVNRRQVATGRDFAAAVVGGDFVIAREGKIATKYVGASDRAPVLDAGKNVAVAVVGSTFLATDGAVILEKYVGAAERVLVAAAADAGGALVGATFVGFAGGKIVEKYVGSAGHDDQIRGKGRLVAASFGSYFLVLDGLRGVIKDQYVGSAGAVNIRGDVAVFTGRDGREQSYSLVTGAFE